MCYYKKEAIVKDKIVPKKYHEIILKNTRHDKDAIKNYNNEHIEKSRNNQEEFYSKLDCPAYLKSQYIWIKDKILFLREIIINQVLLVLSILFFVSGLIILIFSRVYSKKIIIDSVPPRKIKILSKGNPIPIYTFVPFPYPAFLEVKFKAPRGHKAIFRLIRRICIQYPGIVQCTD